MKFSHLCGCFCRMLPLFLVLMLGCDKQEEPDKTKIPKINKQDNRTFTRYGGIYRIPLRNNPSTLDPVYVTGKDGVTLVIQIFERLLEFDSRLMISPGLAESWQVERQGRDFTFFLRKNARFHNNKPVTSKDVVFSICRLLRTNPPIFVLPHLLKIKGARSYRNGDSKGVAGITVINDHELKIKLIEPHTPFLAALGMYQISIVPEGLVNRSGSQFGRQPVGSGPFRFISWKRNQAIWLERFAGYHSGPAFLEKLHYIIYPGEEFETALSDFRNGNLEELPVFGNTRQALSGMIGFKMFSRPSLSILFYGMKQTHPLLREPDFRKALSLAIDRKTLIQEVYQDQFESAITILPPGMPFYRPQAQYQMYNPSEARRRIKKVLRKYPRDGLKLEIVSNSNSHFAKSELKFMRESLARIGIDLTIKFIPDWVKFKKYIKSNTAQIYRSAWFADMPDPDSFLTPLLSSGGSVNHSGYSNEKMDRMLLKARGIIDPMKRAEIYQQIEELVQESTPVIPLFYLSVNRVYQANVRGMEISALGAHTMPLNHIWIDRSAHQKSY